MAKILVVDDEPLLRAGLRRVAEKTGREIFEASNKDEAFTLIEEHDFDIVVTDLIMERSDEEQGLEVMAAAKKKDPLTQVIVVTQYPTAERGVNAMLQGAFDYIERNVPSIDDKKLLAQKIDLALNYREAKRKQFSRQQ
jgi:DNA-binding NtrC family response regulator